MKKILVASAAILCFVILLTGCGGDDSCNVDSSSNSQEEVISDVLNAMSTGTYRYNTYRQPMKKVYRDITRGSITGYSIQIYEIPESVRQANPNSPKYDIEIYTVYNLLEK